MPRTHQRKKTDQEKFERRIPDAALAVGINGDFTVLTDDALIAENHQLEDEIKAGLAKFNDWAKPRKERIEAIESEIRKRLLERGADSTKTDSGTAYFSNIMNTKIEDREILFDFIADNWDEYGSDMLKLGAAVEAVRRYMDHSGGTPPPGLSVSFFKRLNINRS